MPYDGAKIPRAPSTLSKESMRIWRKLVKSYAFDDDQLLVLKVGLEAYDRLQEARSDIKINGLTYLANGLRKENPACKTEKDARAGFLQCLRMLNLQLEI